jgi:hypothetical protein
MWRLPWISRSNHEEMMQLLTSQLSELKAERTILLDRLALLGLGGTLFNLPSSPASSLDTETEAEVIDPAEEALQRIMNIRQPSKRADAITRYERQQARAPFRPPSVARIPQMKVTQALDAAEAMGKKQA